MSSAGAALLAVEEGGRATSGGGGSSVARLLRGREWAPSPWGSPPVGWGRLGTVGDRDPTGSDVSATLGATALSRLL